MINRSTYNRTEQWLTITMVLISVLVVNPLVYAQQDSSLEVHALHKQILDLHAQHRDREALPLAERAVSIMERTLRSDDPHMITPLQDLALLYEATADYPRAIHLYSRALQLMEQPLRPPHPGIVASLHHLAELLLFEGSRAYYSAGQHYEKALEIQERMLGPTHPDTVVSLRHLAKFYQDTGTGSKAIPLFERVLAIRKQDLGANHPDTVASILDLAKFYETIGADHRAMPLYEQALANLEQTLGPDHQNTATVLHDLGKLNFKMESYGKAESLLLRALVIREQMREPFPWSTKEVLEDLDHLYSKTGDNSKSQAVRKRLYAYDEKFMESDTGYMEFDYRNSALEWWAIGDTKSALERLQHSLSLRWVDANKRILTGSESEKLEALAQFHDDVFIAVSISLTVPDQQATRLGLTSVLQIKGRVLDAMSFSLKRVRQRLNQEDQALIDELTAVARIESQLKFRHPESREAKLDSNELSSKREKLEAELSQRSQEFSNLVDPVTISAIQIAIPKGAALVEWYRYNPIDPKIKDEQSRWGKPRYVAYVLKHDGEPVVVDVGEVWRSSRWSMTSEQG